MTTPWTQAQTFWITAVDPPGPRLQILLGDGTPKWTNKGGWQYTGRSRRISVTEYMGDDPYQMVIPCIFEGLINDLGAVDWYFETLRGMMSNLVGPRSEPAIVRVTGPGIPLQDIDWVINTIAVTNEIRLDSGPRTRVEFDLTLFQYIAPEIILRTAAPPAPAAKAIARNGNPKPTRTYIVKKGDTLWALAAKYLGNGLRWHEIANLNGVRDPRRLQIGTRLRIPG